MKQEATDFAILAGSYTKDPKMATQICRLMADGDINETMCKKLLKLIMDGKLMSEIEYKWNWYTYTPTYVQPAYRPWPYWNGIFNSSGNTDIAGSFTNAVSMIASGSSDGLVEAS